MQEAILVGNGLNRALDERDSWNSLLERVAKSRNIEFCKTISMPLEFERIVNEYLKIESSPSPKIYNDIKKEIATIIDEHYS